MGLREKPVNPRIAAMNAARAKKRSPAPKPEPAQTAQNEMGDRYASDYGDATRPLEQRRTGTQPNNRARSAVERAEARLAAARDTRVHRQSPGMDVAFNADEELEEFYAEEEEEPRNARMAPIGRQEPEDRGYSRQALRRNEQGRVVVESRDGRMISRTAFGNNGDKFDVPLEWIPDGWTYQWIAESVLGQGLNNQGFFNNGWERVPALRHDGIYMETGHKGPIIVDGQMLCERRVELTLEARAEEVAAAKGLLRTQNEQFQPRLPGARRHYGAKMQARRVLERLPDDIGRPSLHVDDGGDY